jgi:hypothetical protein
VVVGITGTCLYTYLVTGNQLTSTVTGLSSATQSNVGQRFYPYSLLGSILGVYSNGVAFTVSPSIPINGVSPGMGTQYSSTALYFSTSELTAVLTEVSSSLHSPIVTFQRQTYTLQQEDEVQSAAGRNEDHRGEISGRAMIAEISEGGGCCCGCWLKRGLM